MPRFTFGDSNHLSTNIYGEKGQKLYTVSTPWAFNKVTTITKYIWNEGSSSPSLETMAVIEWRLLGGDTIRFRGKVIEADKMLEKRMWQSGRYFVGPDDQTYKWNIELSYCWLKPADDDSELVRFHKKSFGILKEHHPPYLDISSKVVFMLDHIILTYVYVETLRQNYTKRMSSNISNDITSITNLNDITNPMKQNTQKDISEEN